MLEEGQRLLLPPEIRILQFWNGLGWEMVWDKGRDTFQQSLDTSILPGVGGEPRSLWGS